jgi:hypothetical protein
MRRGAVVEGGRQIPRLPWPPKHHVTLAEGTAAVADVAPPWVDDDQRRRDAGGSGQLRTVGGEQGADELLAPEREQVQVGLGHGLEVGRVAGDPVPGDDAADAL